MSQAPLQVPLDFHSSLPVVGYQYVLTAGVVAASCVAYRYRPPFAIQCRLVAVVPLAAR